MHILYKIAKWLLIIGGINWGLVGLGWLVGGGADWNVIHMIFKSMPTLEGIIYLLVGVAAVKKLLHFKYHKCNMCDDSKDGAQAGNM